VKTGTWRKDIERTKRDQHNVFAPGPTRTRMYLTAFPGTDPTTLPAPEEVAAAIVPLCLPERDENAKCYDFRAGRFLDFQAPA
jgi:hypothetical protein